MPKTPLDRVWHFLHTWSSGDVVHVVERVPLNYADLAEIAAEAARVRQLRKTAESEPLGVDISDYGDDWCAGFLRGQANALDQVIHGQEG